MAVLRLGAAFFLVDVLREDEPEVAFERDVEVEEGPVDVLDWVVFFLVAAFFFVLEALAFLVALFLALLFVSLFACWGLSTIAASPLSALSAMGLLGALLSLAAALAAVLLGFALALAMAAFFSVTSAALRARCREARALALAWRRRTR